MARFNVIDQDNYIPSAGDLLPTEDIVDRDGYRDTKTMVTEMIDAGIRLSEFRREEFEYEEDNPDFEIDPTRIADFDAIDAQKTMELEQARLDALKAKRIAEAEAKKREADAAAAAAAAI